MREIGEQTQFWGTGNIGNEVFDFGEQRNLFQDSVRPVY